MPAGAGMHEFRVAMGDMSCCKPHNQVLSWAFLPDAHRQLTHGIGTSQLFLYRSFE